MNPSYQTSRTNQAKFNRPSFSIQEIKSALDVTQLAREMGVELKPAGSGKMVACCPFHSEKSPSFFIWPERGRWHCFSCNEGGDVLDFLQKIRGQPIREILKDLSGGRWVPSRPDPQREAEKRHAEAIHRWESQYLECLMDFYTVARWYLRRHATRENWLSFSGLIEAMSEAERRMEILSMGSEDARTAFRRGLRARAVVYAW